MRISRLVPSMFHRRLLLLLSVTLVAVAVCALQLGRLTIVHGAELRRQAESRLESLVWVPTVRGRILDRKQRVLAQDRPSFDVTVDYRVINGDWAEVWAGETARKLHRSRWRELGPEERSELVQRYLPAYRAHLDRMWATLAQLTGVEPAELMRRRTEITARVGRLRVSVQSARLRQDVEAALARGREITTEVEEEIARRSLNPIRETRSPHVLLPDVSDEVGFSLLRLEEGVVDLKIDGPAGTHLMSVPLLPGVTVVHSSDREYPFETVRVDVDRGTFPSPVRTADPLSLTVDGVGTRVIGWMGRNPRAEDLSARADRLASDPTLRDRVSVPVGGRLEDRGQYRPGDDVGRAGVESSREEVLRGLRGLHVERLDTGAKREEPRVPGGDIRLSLDIMLQARVQAALSAEAGLAVVQPWHTSSGGEPNPFMPPGTRLNGAAVVLDVDTGEILALASSPSFSRATLRDHPEQVFGDDVDMPFIDRAVARPYPPGSIAKALILCEAVTQGVHDLDSAIACNGHMLPNDESRYRCWVFKMTQDSSRQTHNAQFGGPLLARDALTVSCNIYFFSLGQKLGVNGITRAFHDFGVGRPWNLGVGLEYAGALGRGGVEAALELGDAIQMGIGQGPISWTPLHAADAFATIGRAGIRVRPRLIIDGAPPERVDLRLDPAAVAAALDGLSGSVNRPNGTGNHLTIGGAREPIFNVPGVSVWGKTGTADAPPLLHDPDGREGPQPSRVIRDGDHSWFVVLVGPEGGRPKYSIAVLMEYAGSGGRVSGPIANQIIHALKAEGYF